MAQAYQVWAGVLLAVVLSACGGGGQRSADAGILSDAGADSLSLCNDIQLGTFFSSSPYQIVLDRSAGMAVTMPGTDRTVWERTREALLPFATQGGPIGLTLFPDDGDCARGPVAVPSAIGPRATPDAVQAALAAATPAGGRPAADAVGLAIADGKVLEPLLGRPIVVLFTNGAPEALAGCGGDGDGLAALRRQFESAYDAGIYACIAALPGTGTAADGLRKVALAGAGADPTRACYVDYDTDDGPERLKADFCSFGCQRVPRSCLLHAPIDETTYLDRARLLVTLDDAPTISLERTPGCAEGSPDAGWDVGADGRSIQLCGSLCADYADAWTGSFTLTVLCSVP